MNYLQYTPSKDELKEITLHYWQVWQGLPDLTFENARSDAGEALRYSRDGNYIWVPYLAVEALKNNPKAICLVMCHKCKENKIRAISTEPQKDSLEEVIQKARTLNQQEIDEARKKKNRQEESSILPHMKN